MEQKFGKNSIDIKALREAVLDSFAEWSKPVVGDQPLKAEDDKKKS